MRRSMFVTAALLTLAACSGANAPPPPSQSQAQTPPPADKTVFDTQLKALQKAKDVQKTVDKQQADADKKLEDAGG
ncbi:MAG TPA: hypothetical protein VFB32_18345 [Rudaea sp.]|nr:hypothetical protein [Rudaea sp.]